MADFEFSRYFKKVQKSYRCSQGTKCFCNWGYLKKHHRAHAGIDLLADLESSRHFKRIVVKSCAF